MSNVFVPMAASVLENHRRPGKRPLADNEDSNDPNDDAEFRAFIRAQLLTASSFEHEQEGSLINDGGLDNSLRMPLLPHQRSGMLSLLCLLPRARLASRSSLEVELFYFYFIFQI